MKVVIKSQLSDAQITLQRPHGMTWGLTITASAGDGVPPIIDIELSTDQVHALEKAVGLFT